MNPIRTQVCVLGGGPAGAATARRLASLGHSAVVVEKAPFFLNRIGESLPGAVLPLLDVLGIRQAVESQAFLRPSSSIVQWQGESEPRKAAVPPGFHVHRARFDEELLRGASEAGARILRPARLVRLLPKENGCHTIDIQMANGIAIQIKCDFLVDAMGRGSPLSGRMRRTGQRTIALYAYWQHSNPTQHETALEARPSEWLWGVVLPDQTLSATVFVDAFRLRDKITDYGSVERLYDNLICSSKFFSTWVSGKRSTEVRACDATPLWNETPIQDRMIKVGDASLSIDPLAAQGVHLALGSALHAAAVIHTTLKRPSDETIARRFYLDRQRQSMEFHLRAAGSFYAEAARKYATPFWLTRTESFERGDAGTQTIRIQYNGESRVRVHPSVQFQEVPVIDDEFIVRKQGIYAPQLQAPLVFIDSISIAPLLSTISGIMQCSEVVRNWCCTIPSGKAVSILDRLLRYGVLQIVPQPV